MYVMYINRLSFIIFTRTQSTCISTLYIGRGRGWQQSEENESDGS